MSIYTLPLRERREDIPVLARCFLQECHVELGRTPSIRFSPGALALLSEIEWEGNVRELKACITYALAYAKERSITKKDIQNFFSSHHTKQIPSGSYQLGDLSIESAILKHIANILTRTKGHQSNAAGILGISRQALHKRIKGSPALQNHMKEIPTA